ncbi:MAG: sulfurtransferase [Anaerolineae bacterium]|nr:sulfurtransferase [Anaerolineae bacterium]
MIDFSKNPLIEADWLAAHLTESNLRIVDTRCWGQGVCRNAFLKGHIPGAVHLCWHLNLSHAEDGKRYLIPPPARFAAIMMDAGIGDDTLVVAYAQTDHSGPARLWWALRYYGHDQIAVLNGGLDRWLAGGYGLSTDVTQPRPTEFIAHPQPKWLATGAEIDQALRQPRSDICLVDSRPPEQFSGQALWTPLGSLFFPPGHNWVDLEGRMMRGGHIPGAVNLPASGNLDPIDHWRYLPPPRLKARALSAGVKPERRVITYCGAGIVASQSLFALHLAGYPNLALYDASWEEWGTDLTRPVKL